MEKILKLNKLTGREYYKKWEFGKEIHIPTSNILYYESLYNISDFSKEDIDCIEDNNIRCKIAFSKKTYFGSRIVLKEPLKDGNLIELHVVETPDKIAEQFEN